MNHKHIPLKDKRWSLEKSICVCGFETTDNETFLAHLSPPEPTKPIFKPNFIRTFEYGIDGQLICAGCRGITFKIDQGVDTLITLVMATCTECGDIYVLSEECKK